MTTTAPPKVTWGPTTVFQATKTAAPAPSTSFFGTPSPAAPTTLGFSSSSTFSSQPVTSPGTTGLFSPQGTSTAFTTAPASSSNAFSQVLGAPQQAALQAHMNVTMHQESSRIGTQLMQLYAAYNPTGTGFSTDGSNGNVCRFQHIFYDPITQAQKLEKLSLPHYPPKPAHISDELWNVALTQNPDHEEYIPVLVTSAEGLHTRLVSQQSKMKLHEEYLRQLDDTLTQRMKYNDHVGLKLSNIRHKNIQMRDRLMCIMQKFEIARGKHVPLQVGEEEVVRKLHQLAQHIDFLGRQLEEVQRDGQEYVRQWHLLKHERQRMGMVGGASSDEIDDHTKSRAMNILNEYKVGISELVKVVKKGERDMDIVKKGTGL